MATQHVQPPKPTLEHQGLGVYATAHAPGIYEYPDFYGRSPVHSDLSSGTTTNNNNDYRNHNITTPSALSSSGSSGVFKHFQTPTKQTMIYNGQPVGKTGKGMKMKSPKYAGNKHGCAKNFNDNFKMAHYAFSGQMPMPMTPSTAAPSMPETPFQRSQQVSRQLTATASASCMETSSDPAENLVVPFPGKKVGFLNNSVGGTGGGGVGTGTKGNKKMTPSTEREQQDSLWSALQDVDWSQRGIPTVINNARFVSFYGAAAGNGKILSTQKPVAIDWSAKGMPDLFKVGQPRSDKPKPRMTPKKDLLQIDWSNKGLPIKLTYWEIGMLLDWSDSGIPSPHHPTMRSMSIVLSKTAAKMAGRKYGYSEGGRLEAMDWSEKGLPKQFAKAVGYFRKSPFSNASTADSSASSSELVLDWNAAGVPYEKIGRNPSRKAELTKTVMRGNVQGPLAPTTRDGERQWHAAVIDACSPGSSSKKAQNGKKSNKPQTPRSRFFHRRDVMLKNAFGRQPCLSDAEFGDTIQYGHYLFVVASKPELYKSKAELAEMAENETNNCCDWSGSGIPSALKDTLFDRELAFDWTAGGLPGQFTKDVKRDPFEGNPLMIDWSVKNALPGEFQKLTHERHSKKEITVVDWSGKGAPYGKRQLKDESPLEWHKSGIPPEIKHAQWHLVYGAKFVPSPKAADTVILFKNGFFEAPNSPMSLMASRGVSRDRHGTKMNGTKTMMDSSDNDQHVPGLDAASDTAYGGDRMDLYQLSKNGRIPYEISVGADTQLHVVDKHFAEQKQHKNVDELLADVNDAYHQLHMHRREKANRSSRTASKENSEMNPKIVEELLAFNSGLTPSDPSKLNITKRRPVLTPAQKSDRYWSKQLDWSAEGLPEKIDRTLLEEDRRGKQGLHKGTNLGSRSRYDGKANVSKLEKARSQGAELMIDWAHAGTNKMPPQFRHLESWMHLEGRKHVFDELTIDWSGITDKTPRQLFESVLEKSRKKDADVLMINWSFSGLPFDFVDQVPTDAAFWKKAMQHEEKCKFCVYRKLKQQERAGGWPRDLVVDWGGIQLPYVKVPGKEEKGILLERFGDLYEEPVSADFSGRGLPVNVSVFDNLCIDWGQEGSLDTTMQLTYSVDRGTDAAALKYNLRKNRTWQCPASFTTTDTYMWEDGQIHPATTKKRAVFNREAKRANAAAKYSFQQSFRVISTKRNQYIQKTDVCWVNWAKNGVDLRRTIHKDRQYSMDWGNNGLPFLMETAEFETKGYKFHPRCDWSKDGEVTCMENDGKKVWNPAANARAWVKRNAVPNAISQMNSEKNAKANRGVFYDSVNWNTRGLPDEIKSAQFAAKPMMIDWGGNGIPGIVVEIADEFRLPCDWSKSGLPDAVNLNKRENSEFPASCFTCIDWSWKGLPFVFRKALGMKPDIYTSIDWSRMGLPMMPDGKWDPLVLNWVNRGLPMGGKPYEGQTLVMMDWSTDGLPTLLHDVEFFGELEAENAYSPFSESRTNSKPTYPNHYQQDHASADIGYEQLHLLKTNLKRMNKKSDSPWNRTKDEIRGVKTAHRLFRTKATKRNLFRVMRREIGCGVALLRQQKQQWMGERRCRMRWEKEVWNGKFENLNDVSFLEQKIEQGFVSLEDAKQFSSRGSVASGSKSGRGRAEAREVREMRHMQKQVKEGRTRRGHSRGSREKKGPPKHTDLRPPHLNEDVLVWHLRKNGRAPYLLALGNEYPNGVHSVSVKASWQQREEKSPLPVDRLLKLCDGLLKKLRDSHGQKGGANIRGNERHLGQKVAEKLEPKLEHDEETLVYQITMKSRVPFLLTRGKEFYRSSRIIGRKNQPNVDEMLATCAYLLNRPAPGHETSYLPPGAVMSVWNLKKDGRIPYHLSLGTDVMAKATALEESRNPPFSNDLLRQCKQLLRQVDLREHTLKAQVNYKNDMPKLTETDLLHMVLHRYPNGYLTHSDTTLASRGSDNVFTVSVRMNSKDGDGLIAVPHPAEQALSLVAETFLQQSTKIFDRSPSLSPNELLAVCAELYPPSCLENRDVFDYNTNSRTHKTDLHVPLGKTSLRGMTDQQMAKSTTMWTAKHTGKTQESSSKNSTFLNGDIALADEFPPTLLQDFAAPTFDMLKNNIADPRGPPPAADDLLRICAELYPPERRTTMLRSSIETFREDLDAIVGPCDSRRMIASAKIEYEKTHPRGPPPVADALLKICEELYPAEKRTRVSAQSLRVESLRALSTRSENQTAANLASDILKNANEIEEMDENDEDGDGFTMDAQHAGRTSKISLAQEKRKSAFSPHFTTEMTTDGVSGRMSKISLAHGMRKTEAVDRISAWSRKSALSETEQDEIAALLSHAARAAQLGQLEEHEREGGSEGRNTWRYAFARQPV